MYIKRLYLKMTLKMTENILEIRKKNNFRAKSYNSRNLMEFKLNYLLDKKFLVKI